MDKSFRVPFGLNALGMPVKAADANKGELYSCPECSSSLVVKDGGKNTKHLSHPSNSQCNPESLIHKTAKKLIIDAIHRNAAGEIDLSIINQCVVCLNKFSATIGSNVFDDAQEEVSAGAFVVDVVAFSAGQPKLLIEVKHSHAVSDEKGAELPGYWIELCAEDVITAPNKWVPIQQCLRPAACPGCKEIRLRIKRVAKRWGIADAVYSPLVIENKPYVCRLHKCTRCKAEVPVFWWPGAPKPGVHTEVRRPRTIKPINNAAGTDLVNSCASCGLTFDNHQIFALDAAPFKGFGVVLCQTDDAPLARVQGDGFNKFMAVVKRNLL